MVLPQHKLKLNSVSILLKKSQIIKTSLNGRTCVSLAKSLSYAALNLNQLHVKISPK